MIFLNNRKYLYGNKLVWILGFLFSGIFSFLALRNFQWNTLMKLASKIDPWFFSFAGLSLLISIFIRAYRWRYFLPDSKVYTFHALVSGIALGYFFSNIFPGRLGDIIRPSYVSKVNKQPFPICAYSIVLERLLELVILVVIAFLLLRYNNHVINDVLNVQNAYVFMFVFAGIFILFFAKNIMLLVHNISEKLEWYFLSKSIKDILTAFEGNYTLKRIFILILLSIVIFFLDGLVYVFIFDSFHIPIGFMEKFTVMAVTSLANLFPSAPAGIGVFHYFCKVSLTMFGVNGNVAMSAAILLHAFMFFCDFILGMFVMISGSIKKIGFFKNQLIPGENS